MPPTYAHSPSEDILSAQKIQEESISKKPHWSQWFPIYRSMRMMLDDIDSKPIILTYPTPSTLRSYAVGTWHGLSSVGLMIGLIKGLEFLLK